MEQINEAWKNASEEMYKAQQDGGDAGSAGNGSGSANATDDVTDVDFEEVK
jgi:molecular chaperone DnaK